MFWFVCGTDGNESELTRVTDLKTFFFVSSSASTDLHGFSYFRWGHQSVRYSPCVSPDSVFHCPRVSSLRGVGLKSAAVLIILNQLNGDVNALTACVCVGVSDHRGGDREDHVGAGV